MLTPANVPFPSETQHGSDPTAIDKLVKEMKVGKTYTFVELNRRYREITGAVDDMSTATQVGRALGMRPNLERGRASIDGVQYRVWRRTK